MVQKIIHRLLRRRHPWRYMEFSELAELYTSRVLRVTALTMVSVFVAIFMYQTGYSLFFISVYFMLQFTARGLFAFPSAYLIARIGPKHATLISNILYIPAMLSLSQLETHGLAAIIIYGFFQSISASVYNISHHIDFSVVKHRLHAGKEIGYMVALERIAMAISPVLGGFIAYLFGPQATILVAMFLFLIAALPLLHTPEPIKIHQKINFKKFNWKKSKKSLRSEFFIGWDFGATGVIWSLFIAIAVFGAGSNVLYAQIGSVASVSVIASALTVRMYGLLIDRHRGGELLRFGVFGTALLHLVRPFVSTGTGVVLMNMSTEGTKSAYNMPYLKGVFDLVDDFPAYRIVYMSWMDCMISFGAASSMAAVALLTVWLNDIASLQLFYVFSSIIVLGILSHGLKALRITGP